MHTSSLVKAGLLAAVLALAFVAGWERYWRRQGLVLSYNDDESLWASTRKRIYQSSPARPVFIGSSRIKFDLDQDTWAGLTGQRPVQLALVGTSPRPVLTDLGNDPKFRGTVVVDVTEGIFFAPSGSPPEQRALKRLQAYPKWSLSQQFSFYLDQILESKLLFLDEDRLTLSAFLDRLPIPSRPKVFVFPLFPLKFTYNRPDRQTRMSAAFVADTGMQAQMKHVWMQLGAASPKRGAGGDTLAAVLRAVKQSIDQIRARGGRVLFVRCPSDGLFWQTEKKSYPRALYWDRLLADTRTPGVYFEDYPALARYHCPEWSHLTPRDAAAFTRALVPIMEQKTGWAIAARPGAAAPGPAR